MMKHLLIGLGLAMTITAFSQQNLGFETWAGGNPTGWTTYNGGAAGSVSQITSGAPEGSSAAKLQTGSCPICPSFGLPGTLPGLVYQKVAYSQNPASFDVYVDYNIAVNDTAVIVMQTSAGGVANAVTVAGQRFPGGTSTTGWTQMNFPFATVGTGTIDTLEILAASSDSLVLASGSIQNTASILRVDGIVINLTTGEKEVIAFSEFFAYPNPTAGDFNIVTKNPNAVKVEIYDVTGRRVEVKKFEDQKVKIGTENYASGIYIYKIMDAGNNELKTSKFNVSR